MGSVQLNLKDDQLLIGRVIEAEKLRHHLYHCHICNFIMLLDLYTRNRVAMGLSELKEIMGSHWVNYHSDVSENERLLLWASHFTISKLLVKQRKKENLSPHDITEGHGYIPLQNLRDINEYYAFVGVVLLALKEADVIAILCCSVSKLNSILEHQIPIYYSGYRS